MGDSRINADAPYFQTFLGIFFAACFICIVREDLQAISVQQISNTDVLHICDVLAIAYIKTSKSAPITNIVPKSKKYW